MARACSLPKNFGCHLLHALLPLVLPRNFLKQLSHALTDNLSSSPSPWANDPKISVTAAPAQPCTHLPAYRILASSAQRPANSVIPVNSQVKEFDTMDSQLPKRLVQPLKRKLRAFSRTLTRQPDIKSLAARKEIESIYKTLPLAHNEIWVLVLTPGD